MMSYYSEYISVDRNWADVELYYCALLIVASSCLRIVLDLFQPKTSTFSTRALI